MKKITFKNIMYSSALLATMLVGTGCSKDYADPNNPTTESVFSTVRGITAVSVGLQRIYTAGRASNLYNRVTIDGFTTNQFIIVNRGNLAEDQLERGGAVVDGTNTMLLGLWTSSNKIIYDADNVLEAAEKIGDKGYQSGLIGYTTIFKALALGDLAMFWEKIPDGTGQNVAFINRVEGFNRAVTEIDKALTAIQANPISSAFTSNIPAGVDITNTLRALKARFLLFAGKYAEALTAANAVDLTRKSTFNFDAVTPNSIFETATATNNVYQPIDSTLGLLGSLQPDLADKRVPFYTAIAASQPRFRIKGFADANLTQFPLFLPGEITLIRAECLARQASPDLAGAQAALNSVVTKTTDLYGVAASLPPISTQLTQAQLLDQIYRNRCIELYMSGLKLEDMRRFGRPNSEKRRNLMPYPFRERDNNPNTPPDPPF
jgi:hypothetical protein